MRSLKSFIQIDHMFMNLNCVMVNTDLLMKGVILSSQLSSNIWARCWLELFIICRTVPTLTFSLFHCLYSDLSVGTSEFGDLLDNETLFDENECSSQSEMVSCMNVSRKHGIACDIRKLVPVLSF